MELSRILEEHVPAAESAELMNLLGYVLAGRRKARICLEIMLNCSWREW